MRAALDPLTSSLASRFSVLFVCERIEVPIEHSYAHKIGGFVCEGVGGAACR